MITTNRTEYQPAEQSIESDQQRTLVRILTCGSVDDGKSSLIGRLLHDTKNVYDDQIASIQNGTLNRSSGKIDLSLITDGLRAEREQGITIDVAYRYFSTAKRKYIIADTPGHEQYTRNMATGASTADIAILLIDARHGVLQQSRRHAYVCSLLGIRHAVVAINKMDLVDFSESIFDKIKAEFQADLEQLGFVNPYFVPISALDGDNVVTHSSRIPWFTGPSILEYIDSENIANIVQSAPFRFSVQLVIRPNIDFRGYAGVVASGAVRVGDSISVFPGDRTTSVARIVTFDGDRETANAGDSVTLVLGNELDIARGELFTSIDQPPKISNLFVANIVWMQDAPIRSERTWMIKHTSRQIKARVTRILHRIDINNFTHIPATELNLNEIGQVEFEATHPLYFDPYTENRATGAFILIDTETNATAGAGMLIDTVEEQFREITSFDRTTRYGHTSHVIDLGLRERLALWLEQKIFVLGGFPVVLKYDDNYGVNYGVNMDVIEAFSGMGAVIILVGSGSTPDLPEDDKAALNKLVSTIFEHSTLPQGDYEV